MRAPSLPRLLLATMRRFASADLQRDHPVFPLHRLHGASSVTPRLLRERLLGAQRPAPLLWDAQPQHDAQQRRSLHVSHAKKSSATREVAEEAYGADQIQVRASLHSGQWAARAAATAALECLDPAEPPQHPRRHQQAP
jgi:hypothetical protein